MILAVASGKGGTGKTTIAVALAQSAEKVVFLDADVEEPNAHLFLQDIQVEEKDTIYRMVPEVDEGRCTFCGKCKEICHFHAITVLPGVVLTFPEMCHACYGCVEVCPENCIAPGQKLVGKLFAGEKGNFSLAYGLLEIGEPMSSPLIKALKERFLKPDTLNIIDCPPGTACAVLTAVRGADYCILVTEPTPFGLHDLKQAVGAVKALGVPCGVVVNRAGADYPELYQYLDKERLPLLLEIENDRRVAEAYAQGQPLLEARPDLRAKFQKLLREIAS